MLVQEEDYQDDFENFSDEEVETGEILKTPQPRLPPKMEPLAHLNQSLTEFHQTQSQIKNYIKNTTICTRPPNNRDEQISTTNTTGGTSASKVDVTPIRFANLYNADYGVRKQPMSLKGSGKPEYPKIAHQTFKDLQSIFRLHYNHLAIPSLNNSFQSGQIKRDRIQKSAITKDPRRNSVGLNANSQKRIDPKSPRHEQSYEQTLRNKQVQQPHNSRNSQKIYQKQTSQRSMGMQEPSISAKSWAMVDGVTGQFIAGQQYYVLREVASITKIMTCWVSLQLCKKYNINLDDTFFDVSYYASTVGGTSASLCEGDQVSVRDLLYGLMLPSGNDAAVTLAENFGDYQDGTLDEEDIEALIEFRKSKKGNSHHTDFFLSQMNLWARRFGMTNTYYANPHGLMNDRNKSTAYDIGTLCYRVLSDVLLQKIIATKIYFSEIVDDEGFSKEIFWENTNKMLYKGYIGIKTGITNTAGPCVCEHYRDDKHNLIIVLLNCKSQDERWVDAAKLVDWIKTRQT